MLTLFFCLLYEDELFGYEGNFKENKKDTARITIEIFKASWGEI
ncbi:hypothetical protein SDC9_180282 [bioreactor metagenome]|uniref:Uncharacterized protein n=1 Tax=bioreactor metagenome TaxID=1076179 RepID=A0A645H3A2_9ZZZZ